MPKSSSSKTAQASNMPNLKQGTLSFTSAKRTDSTSNVKFTERGKNKQVETPVEVQNDAKPIEILDISDDESAAAEEITVPVKRTRASTKVLSSSGITKQAPPQLSQSVKQKPSSEGIGRGRLDVQDKAGRYRKHYHEVRSKMGHMEPSKHTRLTINAVDFISFAFSPFGRSKQDTPNPSYF